MKRTHRYFAIVFLSVLLLLGWFLQYNKIAGTIYGPEMNEIVVDGVVYIVATNETCPYSGTDRGAHMGKAAWSDGTRALDLYKVKGDQDFNFLYARWEQEGEMYMREDLIVS